MVFRVLILKLDSMLLHHVFDLDHLYVDWLFE